MPPQLQGRHTSRFDDRFDAIRLAAFHTIIPQDRAMEFQHFFASGLLMQTIDILCDDSLQPAVGLQLRQFFVSDVGSASRNIILSR